MRIVLKWLDQLRTTPVKELKNFCNAVVSQFQDLAAAANVWAAKDHDPTGVHTVVRWKEQTTVPDALAGHLVTYWDGTNLKYVKPDGSTGNIV